VATAWNSRLEGIRVNMKDEEEARGLKLAANESVFRIANERMQRAAASHRFAPDQGVPFLCECADPGCREVVMLSPEEYDRVRGAVLVPARGWA
jgi:hypothetical protein